MNIFDYIKKHSDDHSELWSGAGIFLQAMREGKVQLEGVTGRTLLMCAAELTHSGTCTCFMQLLLGRGADVERRGEAGRTALCLASQHGYLDAVQLLVLSGAQTDTPDNEGKRPFDYATQEHHGDVVQFLLKESKRQKIKDKHGNVTLSGSVEKLSSWQPENRPKIGCGAFPRGLRRLLGKQRVCDLFQTELVICKPYALEHD